MDDQQPIDCDKRLHVMFVLTSMPVGGAETLLVNLVRGLDANRFAPEIACLKEPGPLGEMLAREMPVHSKLLSNKYDLRVLPRLCRLLRRRKTDALVTIGAGDKMFWGRLAAKLARLPVVVSALHSTGWPDSIGRLNRLLTPWTDAFIGVADAHAAHLADQEGFPSAKVHTIYNGVDTSRFAPGDGLNKRHELGIPADAPTLGILAALRPEKNHELFLAGAAQIHRQLPNSRFIIIGDGPQRNQLQQLAHELGIGDVTHFLGPRQDVPEVLRALNVLALTSHNEANPVSILEALSSEVPVVAADVGSVAETVLPNRTGQLFPAGDLDSFVAHCTELLRNPALQTRMGKEGRRLVVEQWSLAAMVNGYETLIQELYTKKLQTARLWPPKLSGGRFGSATASSTT
ncbi:MAG: glycosyltransferase [Planctomycetales bacterium]|nr:glycosyltransferase [Planctomycetales bacterium]